MNPPPLLETLFGANWRTTVSGLATTASLIALALCALPDAIWQSPRVWIPAVLGIIAKTIKDINTKDACVTGQGTVQDPHTAPTPTGGTRVITPVLIGCAAANLLGLGALFATVAVFVGLALSGCAGSAADTDFRSKVKDVKVNTGASYDPATKGASGTIDTQIDFRDPSKDGAERRSGVLPLCAAKAAGCRFYSLLASFDGTVEVLIPCRDFEPTLDGRLPWPPLVLPRFRCSPVDLPNLEVFDVILA